MRAIRNSFLMMLKQIKSDGILVVILIAPFLAAFFFRFGIAYIDSLISSYLEVTSVISPYYQMIDLFLGAITSYMFAFVIAMTMLEEFDNNLIAHLVVTPLKKSGYLISRFLFPFILSWVLSVILLLIFALDDWLIYQIIMLTGLLTLSSFSIMLLIFTFSHNKVEGMAVAKISGITMLGLVVPFVIGDHVQYVFSVLPSFWIAKLAIENQFIFIFMTCFVSFIWIYVLYKKFLKKLSF